MPRTKKKDLRKEIADEWYAKLKTWFWVSPFHYDKLAAMEPGEFGDMGSECNLKFTSGGARTMCELIGKKLWEQKNAGDGNAKGKK